MLGNTADQPPDPPPWSSAAAAARLRDLLDERGLSIASLARALTVTRQTVHRWLQGQHISPANLQRLSEYFQVDIIWLQSGTEAGALRSGGETDSEQALQSDLTAARQLLHQLQVELPITLLLADEDGRLESLAPHQAGLPQLNHPAWLQQAIDTALTGIPNHCSDGHLLIAASPFDGSDRRRALVMLIDTAHLATMTESPAG